MTVDDGIVRPVVTHRTPRLGSLAIMAATGADVQTLRRDFQYPNAQRIYLSNLYFDADSLKTPALVGPVMGAPYAAMVLETLRAWGVKTIVFFGWCGSISENLCIGDILLPESAVIDEGTSVHYQQESGAIIRPDGELFETLDRNLDRSALSHRKGRVWSTDGIFRETPEQINKFQNHGAVAVEMELSALCSAARFYGISFAALLIVSDELFTLQWRPGFKESRFKQSRTAVCHFLTEIYRS